MNKKRNLQDKTKIVMEFINTSISAAELCCKHNIDPTTFQDWKDKFMHDEISLSYPKKTVLY